MQNISRTEVCILVALCATSAVMHSLLRIGLYDQDPVWYYTAAEKIVVSGLHFSPVLEPWPIAYPLLLSLFFFLFGATEDIAISVSILFNSASILLFYFLVKHLLDDKVSSFLAALFLITQRTFLWAGITILADAPSLFLSIGTFYAGLKIPDDSRSWNFILFYVLLGLGTVIHYSTIVILPAVMLSLLIAEDWSYALIARVENLIGGLILILLFSPQLIYNVVYRGGNAFVSVNRYIFIFSQKMNPIFYLNNFLLYLRYFLLDAISPLFLIFSFVGGYELFSRSKKKFYFVLLWFLGFVLLYSGFGFELRWSLWGLPQMLIFGSYGLVLFCKKLESRLRGITQ